MSNRSTQIVRPLLALILYLCLLWISPLAWAGNLEETVLRIIDQHPEVIVRSLSNYQRQQRERQDQAKDIQIRQQVSQVLRQSPVIGDARAEVVLIEFADFQCPFCKDAAKELKHLHEQFPGVTFAFKHLPLAELHPQAFSAAIAAWAAGQQGKFWEYHDALFERQTQLNASTYREIAHQLKLDLSKFETDQHSEAAISAISQDIALAQSWEINATPFFLVVRPDRIDRISGMNLTTIVSAINKEL